jgi:hypothetical protein
LNSKCEKSDFYNYKRPNGRKFKNCINEWKFKNKYKI